MFRSWLIAHLGVRHCLSCLLVFLFVYICAFIGHRDVIVNNIVYAISVVIFAILFGGICGWDKYNVSGLVAITIVILGYKMCSHPSLDGFQTKYIIGAVCGIPVAIWDGIFVWNHMDDVLSRRTKYLSSGTDLFGFSYLYLIDRVLASAASTAVCVMLFLFFFSSQYEEMISRYNS